MTWLIRPEDPVDYQTAAAAMHELADRRARDDVPDTLVLLEHPPVYTAGTRARADHVLWGHDRMEAEGASFHEVDRGGSVTFHGPGQLVGYPVVDLGRRPDLAAYLSRLEEVIIRAGRDYGIRLGRDPIQAGVWAGEAKVCAIGIRLMRWRITLHGFGLNCDPDLSWFDAIVPCGLADRSVTSLSQLAGRRISVAETAPAVMAHYAEVFDTGFEDAPAPIAETFRGAA